MSVSENLIFRNIVECVSYRCVMYHNVCHVSYGVLCIIRCHISYGVSSSLSCIICCHVSCGVRVMYHVCIIRCHISFGVSSCVISIIRCHISYGVSYIILTFRFIESV